MVRFLFFAALMLVLPGAALADDGGMAAPGAQSGDVAAPAEAPPVAVETPPTDPMMGDETVPPEDIGPYGPHHQAVAPVHSAPVVAGEAAPDSAAAEAAPPAWPRVEAHAAPPITPPGELVGAFSPGAQAEVASGAPGQIWLFLGMTLAFLVAVVAAIAAIRSGSRTAGRRATPQSLHRFA